MIPHPPAQRDPAELPLFQRREPVPVQREIATPRNVDWLVTTLAGRDWTLARELCAELGWPATENNKRRIRALADASGGRIIGGQRGYRLVRELTGEEYHWWRNETLKMSDSLKARVIESDRNFFGRAAI